MNLSHLDADFALIDDDQETVRLRFVDGPATFAVDHALQRPVNRREMDVSKGFYQAHDVRFSLYAAECNQAPVPGCTIIVPAVDGFTEATEYTVLEARLESVGSVWACIARNLVITERLDTLFTIQEGNFAKAPHGADEAEWADLYPNVRGRMQPENSGQQVQRGQRVLKRKYTLFVREMFALRRQHRIVGPDGKLYRVTGFNNAERIDRLTEISCEEW